MMSRFSSDSNSPVRVEACASRVKVYPDGADAVLDSATILARTSHADARRTFPSRFQEDLSYGVTRGGLLDNCRRRPAISRRFRPGRCRQHWSRRAGNWARYGGAVFADCIRAYFAISHRSSGKIGRTIARDGSAEFSSWRPRLLYFRRIGSHRNSDKTRAPVSHRKRAEGSLPRSFPPPELSRQHAWRDVRQRQRRAPRALRTARRGMGAHRSVFLLSLPVRKNFSPMRNRVRR